MTGQDSGGPTGRVVASSTRVVPIPASGRLGDLLDGRRPGEIFTPAEQRLCADRADLTGWAGRLAAKLAVMDLLAGGSGPTTAALQVQILPDRGRCPGEPCHRSHPPAVHLSHRAQPALPAGHELRLSIAHTRRTAVATAVLAGGG